MTERTPMGAHANWKDEMTSSELLEQEAQHLATAKARHDAAIAGHLEAIAKDLTEKHGLEFSVSDGLIEASIIHLWAIRHDPSYGAWWFVEDDGDFGETDYSVGGSFEAVFGGLQSVIRDRAEFATKQFAAIGKVRGVLKTKPSNPWPRV